MRVVAAAVLLSLLCGSAPFLCGNRKPDCCRDERHCAMHRQQGKGCRMGACQRDGASVIAIGKAVFAPVSIAAPSVVFDAAWIPVAQFELSHAPQPSVPPPRA